MLRVGVVCVQARLRVVAAAVTAGAEVAAEAAPAVATAQKGATANAAQSAVKALVTSFIALGPSRSLGKAEVKYKRTETRLPCPVASAPAVGRFPRVLPCQAAQHRT